MVRESVVSRLRVRVQVEQLTDFCRRWKITELAVFGSVVRNDFRPDSDVDVLVSFARHAGWSLARIVEMADELRVIFGREVDVVETEALRNPFRRHAMLTTREVLYAA